MNVNFLSEVPQLFYFCITEAAVIEERSSPLDFSVLIFDATMWSFVDWTAGREIVQIIDKFRELEVAVLFAGLSCKFNLTRDFFLSTFPPVTGKPRWRYT